VIDVICVVGGSAAKELPLHICGFSVWNFRDPWTLSNGRLATLLGIGLCVSGSLSR